MGGRDSKSTEKTTWDNLCKVITQDSLHLLGRDSQGEKKYQEWRTDTRERYYSISDVIYINIFKCDWESSQGKYAAKKNSKKYDVVLKKNDFPYYLSDDITHFLLWSFWALTSKDIVEIVNKITNDEFVYFVNPEHLQSIKDVWHAHIFIRNQNKT